MALEGPHPESATSTTQQAFDGVVGILTAAAADRPVTIGTLGGLPPTDIHDVLISPLSLTRVGRSRRAGSLLDLELAVAVQVGGESVRTLTERMLLAVEVAGVLAVGLFVIGVAGVGRGAGDRWPAWASPRPVGGDPLTPAELRSRLDCRIQGDTIIFVQRLRGRGGARQAVPRRIQGVVTWWCRWPGSSSVS